MRILLAAIFGNMRKLKVKTGKESTGSGKEYSNQTKIAHLFHLTDSLYLDQVCSITIQRN
jgi:hypothetical protein